MRSYDKESDWSLIGLGGAAVVLVGLVVTAGLLLGGAVFAVLK